MSRESKKQLNAQLQIKYITHATFRSPSGKEESLYAAHVFYIEGKGYVKFKNNPSPVPYAPMGGKRALQDILEAGGFLSYTGIEFVNPIFSYYPL